MATAATVGHLIGASKCRWRSEGGRTNSRKHDGLLCVSCASRKTVSKGLTMVFGRSIEWALGLVCFLTLAHPVYGGTDPCSLLTPAQVSAVLGVNVGAGNSLAPTVCDWTLPNRSPAVAGKRVTVTLQKPLAFAFAKMPANSPGITKTPVSGIGDDAVYGTAGGAATLTVKKGEVVFVVHVYGFPMDQLEDKEKILAKEIVSKL